MHRHPWQDLGKNGVSCARILRHWLILPHRSPGSIIAGAWAVMTHLGQEGYAHSCEVIISAARRLKTALHQDPILAADLYVLGDPMVSVVAFGSNSVNIYAVGDAMGKKGWHLNALANPSALHLAVTVSNVFRVI